jgi:hypothetical protein
MSCRGVSGEKIYLLNNFWRKVFFRSSSNLFFFSVTSFSFSSMVRTPLSIRSFSFLLSVERFKS